MNPREVAIRICMAFKYLRATVDGREISNPLDYVNSKKTVTFWF